MLLLIPQTHMTSKTGFSQSPSYSTRGGALYGKGRIRADGKAVFLIANQAVPLHFGEF